MEQMVTKAQKIKSIVKKVAPKSTFGTNPLDPWSAKANISETALLDKYLKVKGYNPMTVPKNTKVAHSKSNAFKKWANDHINVATEAVIPMSNAKKDHTAVERKSVIQKSTHSGKEIKTPHGPGSHNEETELDEVSSELLGRYKEKAKKSADDLTSKGQHKKSTNRWMNVMKATGKQMAKTTQNIKKSLNKEEKGLKKVGENVGDPQAAVNADGLNTQMDTMQPNNSSRHSKIIKNIYKKKKMVEDMFDHEKEDKSVKTYGKKPKFDKPDEKDSQGENKPQAAATLSGGTTLTGNKRDTIEIDPAMRNRPGQPDVTKKKDDKDKGEKKDEKKDK